MAKRFERVSTTEAASGPIPTAIRALREQLGISQKQLAHSLFVEPITETRWEMGDREPGKWLLMYMLLAAKPPAQAQFEAILGMSKMDVERLSRLRYTDKDLDLAPRPLQADPYDELFKNLRAVIDSGQSPLIGHAEEVLARLADDAAHMTRKRKGKG